MAAIKGQPAPKPSQVASPVPDTTGADTADAFLAEFDAPEMDAVSPEAAAPESPGLAGQAVDAVARAADFAGGVLRTGTAAAISGPAPIPGESEMEYQERLQANPGVVTPEAVKQTLMGKAPDTAEYLRRLGVPEGGSFTVPGTGIKLSARGAVGFAGDMASDPLTVISKTIKGLPYLKKLLNAPGAASEALGAAIYKTAVSSAERKLVKAGAARAGEKPVGEALIAAGAPVGGAETLAQKVDDISEVMGKVRQGLYDRATELGVTIDTAYPMKRAEGILKQMRTNPGLRGAADELQQMLDAYKAEGKITIDRMSEWKTQLYDSLPKSSWGPNGRLTTQAKKFKAALAADMRGIIIQAGNAAEKGLGEAINKLNDQWGTLLDAGKYMGPETGGTLGKMIDGAVLATGGIKGVVTKKAYELAKGPYAKTLAGRALMEAGKRDLANRAVRQAFAASQRPSPLLPEDEDL